MIPPFLRLCFLSLMFLICSCEGESESTKVFSKPTPAYNEDSVKKLFIRGNQQVVQKEIDEMDYYAKSHQMPFVKTKSGIRYFVYKPSAKGDSIKEQVQKSLDLTKAAQAAQSKDQLRRADSLFDLALRLKTLTLSYDVKLLDGSICYSSKTEGRKTFVVEEGNIESGIHKAVFYLKRGDKALVMIPSHLAHGLLGDFKKIPPQVPIIYDLEIHY